MCSSMSTVYLSVTRISIKILTYGHQVPVKTSLGKYTGLNELWEYYMIKAGWMMPNEHKANQQL